MNANMQGMNMNANFNQMPNQQFNQQNQPYPNDMNFKVNTNMGMGMPNMQINMQGIPN